MTHSIVSRYLSVKTSEADTHHASCKPGSSVSSQSHWILIAVVDVSCSDGHAGGGTEAADALEEVVISRMPEDDFDSYGPVTVTKKEHCKHRAPKCVQGACKHVRSIQEHHMASVACGVDI
jgi:hypothetical protein